MKGHKQQSRTSVQCLINPHSCTGFSFSSTKYCKHAYSRLSSNSKQCSG